MLTRIFASCTATLLAVCGTGCSMAARQPTDPEYPPVLPIWIVEDDPHTTIFDRKDLERDRRVGKMLVIPLYRHVQHDKAAESLAIAHPFVYEQGEDIEKHLSSVGQREKLHALVFWVPGYFPDGLGSTPDWTPIINGKRMITKELQRCIGSEESKINSAMRGLLMNGDFAIGQKLRLKVPPVDRSKSTDLLGELRTAIEPYNADLVVRSMEYNGRFYNNGGVLNVHVLWGFPPGTKIVNRLSDEEKKTVAAFYEEVTRKAKRLPKNEKATAPTDHPNKSPEPLARADKGVSTIIHSRWPFEDGRADVS
jgi:hypothetical protein